MSNPIFHVEVEATASPTEVKVTVSNGPKGEDGEGVPVGGTTGQILRKSSDTDFDTEWRSLVASDIPGAVQTLSQPSIGQIAISDGNTVDLNTVNMSGDQTGIAGDKGWSGAHTFSALSGVGNGIVGVNASGTLTRNNPSDLGFVPYTGATQGVDLNTQGLNLGGVFEKNENVFDKRQLIFGATSNQTHFTKLKDVASLAFNASNPAVGDIIITLPIRTATKWVAKVDLYSSSNGSAITVPTTLYISGQNTNNVQAVVYGIGGISQISTVKFGRVDNNTVIIIKRDNVDRVFQYGRVNISEFYHSGGYNAALADRANYNVDLLQESSLTGFTLNTEINNAQFTRDPYYLDANNFINMPTIPAAQVNSDWNATSGAAEILNKPTIGTSAALNVGTGADNVVQLDGTGRLPAVDGSQLTGMTSARQQVIPITTAITLDETHENNVILATSGNISITIPTDASDNLPIGYRVNIINEGTGTVSFSATEITLTSIDGTADDVVTLSAAALIKTAANRWSLLL